MLGRGLVAWLLLGPPAKAEPPVDTPPQPSTPEPQLRSPAYADVLEPLPEAQRDEARARLLMTSAKASFADERYADAIEFLAEAYRLHPNVTLLYSLGSAHRRAYERDGDVEHRRLSIRRYQQYLSAAPDGESANLAQNYLTALLAEADLGRSELEVVTRILVSTAAEDASMSFDGGAAQPAPGVINVEPGTHEVTITAPGYAPFVQSIDVPEGATYQVHAELEGLPGSIVLAGTKRAIVRLDGDVVGQLPLRKPIEVEPGEHVLTVSKHGHEPLRVEFELPRQGWKSVQAQLDLSNQRVASYFLFGLGSGAAVSASVLLGFTLDRQTRAQRFTDELTQGELTTDEYNTYVGYVGQRNAFRAATVITGFSGGVLLLAGAVLFAYEGPRAAERALARVRPSLGGLSVRF